MALFCLVAVAAGLWHPMAGALGLASTIFCVAFFRNPKRVAPTGPGLLIVPADGRVIFVGRAMEPDFLKRDMQKVTIFMSPFNVHVNRSPAAGLVKDKKYHAGKFLAAFDPKASELNERCALHLKTDDDDDVVFVQIAGWFARRIVCYPYLGEYLGRGKIFGLIKFGSRMDVYFPESFCPAVSLNQKVKAGETVLASRGRTVTEGKI
jgi:phosphatidylserine decarboxylase